MRSIVPLPRILSKSLALALGLSFAAVYGPVTAYAAPKAKAAPKKSAKEVSSSDDALQKQMDWENKVLGPNTEKKIDLAKIQKLQAEEMARREKQEKIDKVEKDRRDREAAAAAAAQRNVHAAGTREVPDVEEAPPPPKPAEKHDDAFVDKLLKDKSLPKKKASVTNDEVDQLLNQAKQEKPVQTAGKGKGGKSDGVDQLLATADKQPTIKTTVKRPSVSDEPVSAEAAAREAAMKAIAAASAKSDEDRNRNRRPVIPDAAVLRARAEANARANPPPTPPSRPSAKSGWSDPFAADAPAPSKRDRVTTSVRPPPDVDPPAPPTSGRRGSSRSGGGRDWKDPFDAGDGGGSAPRAKPSSPSKKPAKHPANWKDPFA
ncbi:MAG TPA: hypothetical protein VGP07_18000 [Polyangia bacterium]|jgi:hypothetical protein